MIRKLRIKFIVAAMTSLLVVVTAITGTVGVLNYQKILADADSTLTLLAENGGFFPSTPQIPLSLKADASRHIPDKRADPAAGAPF